MKIYLVVEYADYGPGYGLYRNVQAFTSKSLAEQERDKLNAEEKSYITQYEIDCGLYYESFGIEEHDVDTSETVH
jgi:hypothetical protein